MNQRGIFEIIVRAVGLITILLGLEAFFEGAAFIVGLTEGGFASKYWASKGLFQMFVGLLLLRGARPVVELAFPTENPQGQEARAEAKHEHNKESA